MLNPEYPDLILLASDLDFPERMRLTVATPDEMPPGLRTYLVLGPVATGMPVSFPLGRASYL